MIVKIFTNALPGGWSPEELESSLGGSEECVTLLAQELAKDYQVTVYHTQKEDKDFSHNGVLYQSREKANINDDEVLITFKDNTPWLQGARGKVNIHWSSDVEKPWDVKHLDHFINLTSFHQSRNLWVPSRMSKVVPHGIDLDSLDKNRVNKKTNTLLYCSSPDRGLEVLLNDWPMIREKFPHFKLKVAYGFNLLLACTRNDKRAQSYINHMLELMSDNDVQYLGALSRDEIEKEYWRSEFWILPLQRPESELFCLNAVKSAYCGAIPIVNRIGALNNTVGEHVPYGKFIENKLVTTDKRPAQVKPQKWSDIVTQYWKPLIEG